MKKLAVLLPVLTLGILLSACSSQNSTNSINSPQQQIVQRGISTSTPNPTPTATLSLPPTASATYTATVDRDQVDASGTSTVTLTMNGDTNCRSGPGTRYPLLGMINAGEQVEMVGRYILDDYYLVQFPGSENQTCWVWDEYATVNGNTSILPLVTAPPAPTATITPTPTTAPVDFTLTYLGVDKCTIDSVDQYIVHIAIENTGWVYWQSMRAVLTDTQTLDTYVYDYNDFVGADGCTLNYEKQVDQILDRKTQTVALIGTRMLEYDPSGIEFKLKVTVYNHENQRGIDVTKKIYFTP